MPIPSIHTESNPLKPRYDMVVGFDSMRGPVRAFLKSWASDGRMTIFVNRGKWWHGAYDPGETIEVDAPRVAPWHNFRTARRTWTPVEWDLTRASP